jgi:hypothetical protein
VHQLADLTAEDKPGSSSLDTADFIFDIVCVFIAIVQAVRTNNSPKVILEAWHYEVAVVGTCQTVWQFSAPT